MNNISAHQHNHQIITIPTKNYNGITFAAALRASMNAAIGFGTTFTVVYDLNDNNIKITQLDNFDRYLFTLISDDDLVAGNLWNQPVPQSEMIHSMNGILRLGENFSFSTVAAYNAYIDLHNVRNLYITSSSLASYTTISKFGNDLIIKKIPVRANYGQIVFDGSSNG
jgi:hypothetical protein